MWGEGVGVGRVSGGECSSRWAATRNVSGRTQDDAQSE